MGVDRKTIVMMFAIAGSLAMSVNAPASAEEIYKSVDKAGKVTYSTAPRADAVIMKKLEPLHRPTPEEVSAAEEQHQLIETFGAELEKNRKCLCRRSTLYRISSLDFLWSDRMRVAECKRQVLR